jgi:hypothetical protein
MKYMPESCPKCGNMLVRNPKGGRPTRWCFLDNHRQSVGGAQRLATGDAFVGVVGRPQALLRIRGFDHPLSVGFAVRIRAKCACMTSRQDTDPVFIKPTSQ